MAYAETADLSLSAQRLIELTDSADDPGVADETLLAQLEAETERIVNATTTKGPYADGEVPPLIKTITAWVWAYRIYRHREVMEIPKPIMDDYQMALSMMDQIRSGGMGVDPPADDFDNVPRVKSSEPRGFTHRGRSD